MATAAEIEAMLKKSTDSIQSSVNGLSEKFDDMSTSVKSIISTQSTLQVECTELRKEVKFLKDQVNFLENDRRRNNVILFHVPDTVEINKNVLNFVMDLFNKAELSIPSCCYDTAFRLGKVLGERPILVQFTSQRWKRDVFSKAANLRESGYSVSNDLSKEEREIRRTKLAVISKLTSKGFKASLRGTSIFVNGKQISDEKASSLLLNEDPPSDSNTLKSPLMPPPLPPSKPNVNKKSSNGTKKISERKSKKIDSKPKQRTSSISSGSQSDSRLVGWVSGTSAGSTRSVTLKGSSGGDKS